MKIVVGISGASGVGLGVRFLQLIPKDIEVFAIISKSAKKNLKLETNLSLPKRSNIKYYKDKNLDANISSGSFMVDKYIILPCSMNTLAKCANGISNTLISRVFSVSLKEKRDIILSPRELPYNTIQLKNMAYLSSIGVVIAPPVLGYYSGAKSLEEMEDFLIGKYFDLLKIEHNLYKRWEGV